jgi:hypothetical protein
MKEEEAYRSVARWMKTSNFQEEDFYFGLTNPRCHPDFMINRPRKMMVEVKGSKFSLTTLIGQIVYYSLSFPHRQLIIAVPAKLEQLRVLKQKLRKHGFNFQVLDVSKIGEFKTVEEG